MEKSAEFLSKLERELEKIEIELVEEMKEDSNIKTLVPIIKDPKSFLAQNFKLDSGENFESSSGDPAAVWTREDSYKLVEYALDEPKSLSTCTESLKFPVIRDPAEKSEKMADSSPANASTEVKPDSDVEESFRGQDHNLKTKQSTSTAEDPRSSRVDGKVVSGNIQFKDYFNLEKEPLTTEEELIVLLLPEEKKELKKLSNATKLQSELIETRSKILYSRLRTEAEAHCLSIQQKAIEETSVFKRPSSEVTKEYSLTILMVMKYLEIQLKKVASSEESIMKSVDEDFNKNVQQLFNKVAERKLQRKIKVFRLAKKYRKYIEKPSHVYNPLVFYITFVIIMTLFSLYVVHLQNLK